MTHIYWFLVEVPKIDNGICELTSVKHSLLVVSQSILVKKTQKSITNGNIQEKVIARKSSSYEAHSWEIKATNGIQLEGSRKKMRHYVYQSLGLGD